MIIYHADDYGINIEQSKRILRCRKEGHLNSVSIVPNTKFMGEAVKLLDGECKKGVHINLCEGRPLCDPAEVPLLVDGNGIFDKSFFGLFIISLFRGHELERQAEKECYAQLESVLKYMPEGYRLRVDSHRHYHLIPAVMRGLVKALKRTGKEVEYLRLPMEDLSLYVKVPGLWRKIRGLSLFKALILIMFSRYNGKCLEESGLREKAGKYIGVVFTDRMFTENLRPLVKVLKDDRRYDGKDVEVQFHPGAIYDGEYLLVDTFKEWFASPNRTKEAETMIVGLEG